MEYPLWSTQLMNYSLKTVFCWFCSRWFFCWDMVLILHPESCSCRRDMVKMEITTQVITVVNKRPTNQRQKLHFHGDQSYISYFGVLCGPPMFWFYAVYLLNHMVVCGRCFKGISWIFFPLLHLVCIMYCMILNDNTALPSFLLLINVRIRLMDYWEVSAHF